MPSHADEAWMREAIAAGEEVRTRTSPNPWVGCVLVPEGEHPAVQAATEPPGGLHAEAGVLTLAGSSAAGSTVYVTLEPCSHHGRTPPCADALIASMVRRVVVGILDPDRRVAGAGIGRLRAAGIEVDVGTCAPEIEVALAPYLKHRRTGRPWVVLKLATTLDGRIAAPDHSSRWITGPLARADVQRLRAESDAIVVGAGTISIDDPQLTVRDSADRQPLRVVLGDCPPEARAQPVLSLTGEVGGVLDELGSREVIQVLVEGGSRVAYQFHHAGLVDRYVVYLAPALLGGDDGVPLMTGAGAPTMTDLWRGRVIDVTRLGDDVKIELAPQVLSPLAAETAELAQSRDLRAAQAAPASQHGDLAFADADHLRCR